MKSKKIFIILCLVALLGSFGISYLFFSAMGAGKVSSPVPKVTNGEVTFDDSLPKTEPCPMNGQKYSKQQRDWWEKHRPLGVMIENHENSRPQSGLSSADVIYEVVAEGGITRFLSVFHCQNFAQVGPIRSARTYFLDFISEYGDSPLYVHVGGANTPGPANALGQIGDYGWDGYNDMNQFSIGFPTFWRDYNRLGHATATEHTMYSNTQKLWEFAKTRKLTNVGEDDTPWKKGFVEYKYKEDAPGTKSSSIHLEFWSSNKDYFVDWAYDPATNLYMRKNGGVAHIDQNTKKQLSTKNLAILYMKESNANDGYENNAHLLYGTEGTGKAVIFMDGKRIEGKWSKESRTDRTILNDSTGAEIKFNRGKIWFEILPTDGVLSVK